MLRNDGLSRVQQKRSPAHRREGLGGTYPDSAGEFGFSCQMAMLGGRLIVQRRLAMNRSSTLFHVLILALALLAGRVAAEQGGH